MRIVEFIASHLRGNSSFFRKFYNININVDKMSMGRGFILFPPIRSIPLIKLFCPLFEELFKRDTCYSFFE